ncbi:protein MpRLK-Pelle_WAK_LRK10L-9 [Marchantia polymorpha subsp. ruderalis]|uniref:Protein kinase domain-containing protein n=2 Tax=Marchantia polymorpha TaxID=3197 RepID=A0AAF6BGM1_MARPO|nr:hypothetical protein MARPO_0095s0007 [Marchantia polymorpha]BAF79942.1 receptor-like kinase [Marchantia polymorpha]BBN11155.1 hypothetical protein Mp_5g09530 [Marchantia polymorpha subsp. ruderalis]|eukprot:PTQ32743.1 hypothetical protein MARPO_0095s0007 [Marchantia polymorpha]
MPRFALHETVRRNLASRFGRCLYVGATNKEKVVPLFDGDRGNPKRAHEWMRVYCKWAVQEGLSQDQTLLIAVDHMFVNAYGWATQFLNGVSWEEFMTGFYREYVTNNGAVIQAVRGWYRMLKKAKAVPFIRFSGRELATATDDFAPRHIVGEGGFGVVYMAHLPGNQVVAVKKLKGASKEAMQQAHNEVEILSQFRHPNLVKLLGCCLEQRDPLLVYEYIPNGNLMQHLCGEMKKTLTWENRMSIAIGTAEAITHLHSCGSSPVYHRDVKSNNILLDHDLNAKIADFGLSKFVQTLNFVATHITTTPQGTHGYVDPCYLQTFHLTEKSDVYSFGIVLLELVAGMRVLDMSRPEGEWSIVYVAIDRVTKGRFESFLDPKLKESEPDCIEQALDITTLALKCLTLSLEDRPVMKQVLQELHCIQDNWVLV